MLANNVELIATRSVAMSTHCECQSEYVPVVSPADTAILGYSCHTCTWHRRTERVHKRWAVRSPRATPNKVHSRVTQRARIRGTHVCQRLPIGHFLTDFHQGKFSYFDPPSVFPGDGLATEAIILQLAS